MTLKCVKNCWYCDGAFVPCEFVRLVRLCRMLEDCISLKVDRYDVVCHLVTAYKQVGLDIDRGKVRFRTAVKYLVMAEDMIVDRCEHWMPRNRFRFSKDMAKYMDKKGFFPTKSEGGDSSIFLDYRKGV